MKVIGYARLSSGSEESTSIARQHEIIEKHAAARGWELLEIVADPIASATKLRLNRPGLTRVRQAIETGEADAVVVWRLDRIARSVVDFGTLLDEGVSIVSATEPLDTTTPMGRAMAEILQVFAAMEARAISARISTSVDYLRRNDRFPGGRPPYGYRTAPSPAGVGRVLEIDPDRAAVVQEAAARVLGGDSLYVVARDLTSRGIPSATGRGWSVQALQGVLIGEAILGRVTTRGELVRDEHGLPREVWPAILTVDESLRLRELLAPRREIGPRLKAARLLSGFLYCSGCNHRLVVQRRRTPRTRDGKTFIESTNYRCRSQGAGWHCESPVSIRADFVEEHVSEAFLRIVGGAEVYERHVSEPDPVGLALVEDAIQETAQAMTRPGADLPALIERLNLLHARREEVNAHPVAAIETLVPSGQTFGDLWAARDEAGRRALLAEALDHVVVKPSPNRSKGHSPERVEIVWSADSAAERD